MFNERAVCQAIIDCCCELEWPSSRFLVQVLDDSTDKVTRELVDEKVMEWRERGVQIECRRRTNRQGYKAGAMKEGMEILATGGYQYVAVFDADFKPEPDFLLKTVPYLEGNPKVGYVQTRWVFTNPDESYLTKAQEVSLNYHMKCEQYSHSAAGSFFNFNGTAGVWRRACIESAGGWNSRTTVEDMDLSLRAYVKGWKAIFLDDVTCLNELPASFFAFRKQQHRWTCGPVQLWLRTWRDIAAAPIPFPRKVELLVMYFGVRKCSTHFVALGFFCTLVPLTMYTPDVTIPMWVLVHLPVTVTLTTACFTPRGWVYSILYVLFENAMSLVKLWAVVTGLFDLQRAQEWVVTTKLGSSDKRPGTFGSASFAPSCKAYGGELVMGLFLMTAGMWGLFSGHHWGMATYFLLQGCVFFAFGFNMVDTGGILGGRLDTGLFGLSSGVPVAKKSQRELRRRQTIPIIQLSSHEQVPLTEATLSAKSASAAKLTTSADLGLVYVPFSPPPPAGARLPRPSSPTHSSGSESDQSVPSVGSSASTTGPPLSVIKLEDRWHSPTSSLANIYAPRRKIAVSGQRRGWKFGLRGNNGYISEHSD